MSTQEELMEHAEERLTTAKILLEHERYEDAVSRAYYATFHAAKALLATKDSSPRTHAGVASELGNLFREELGTELTSEFSRIQQLREDADYGVETDIDKETAQDIFSTAQRFVDRVDELL